jgi:hypothetical protein
MGDSSHFIRMTFFIFDDNPLITCVVLNKFILARDLAHLEVKVMKEIHNLCWIYYVPKQIDRRVNTANGSNLQSQ